MLDGRVPRLIIAVTHHDLHILNENVVKRLQTEFAQYGAVAEIVDVAPFSDRPDDVPAGFGIADLINHTVGKLPDRPIFWRSTEPAEGDRGYLCYRRDR
jgi:hypothetical protein